MRDDGQVPAPRRGRPRLRRGTGPAAVDLPTVTALAPATGQTPRVAEISALLSEISALRTTLSTDLSLAAAALESDAHDVADEVVTGDLQALHAFEQSALGHLRSLATPTVSLGAAVPRTARRRAARMLPAAPVLAAAALIGFVAGVVPMDPAPTPAPAMTSAAAAASWELNRLAEADAPAEELRAAAERLNDRLADLVEVAAADPGAAQQALLLLRDTTAVLQESDDAAELADVLAETRALVARLVAALPRTPQVAAPQALTGPVDQLTRVPGARADARREARAGQRPRRSLVVVPLLPAPAPAAERQAPAATPAADPSPKPRANPSQQATPTASPSPSPSPSQGPSPDPVLPAGTGTGTGTGLLRGV